MYICPSLGLVFLAQPRTASRAVARWLQEEHHALVNPTAGVRGYTGHHAVDPAEIKRLRARGFRVVTHVRNHWDLMASFWYQKRWAVTLPEFARTQMRKSKWFQPHSAFFLYQPLADVVIRWEELESGWEDLLGFKPRFKRYGDSRRPRPYTADYDDRTARLLGRWYRDEIAHYGYTFGDAA